MVLLDDSCVLVLVRALYSPSFLCGIIQALFGRSQSFVRVASIPSKHLINVAVQSIGSEASKTENMI